MANVNCLEGWACPRCGNEDEFNIQVLSTVRLTDDGTDAYAVDDGGGAEWDDDSYVQCVECDLEGIVADFNLDTPTYEKCGACHLFVERNEAGGEGVAEWIHLHRGDEADEIIDGSHDACPSGQIHSLHYWKQHGPEPMLDRFTDLTVPATITLHLQVARGPYLAYDTVGEFEAAVDNWIGDAWGATDHELHNNAMTVESIDVKGAGR
jgi:hypothetical protein